MDFFSLGFTHFDVMLLVACTIGALFGSFAHAIMLTIGLDGPPRTDEDMTVAPPHIAKLRGMWLYMRLFLGAIMGFVFGLYFVGTLHETAGTFARIWALSFIVGYAAPKIWVAKEELMMRKVRAESAKHAE